MRVELQSGKVLKAFFARKREKNPGFSLRLLSQKVGISPAFVSKIMNGAKPLPAARIGDFVKALDIDAFGARKLHRAVGADLALDAKAQDNLAFALEAADTLPSEKFAPAGKGSYAILDDWYYLALLDLVDTKGFRSEPSWISHRLGLKEDVARQAWQRLLALRVVAERDGRWIKQTDNLIFPASRIDPQVQKFHAAMIRKATDEMKTGVSPSAHERRLILSATVSTNAEAVQKAKRYLEEAFCKALEIMSAAGEEADAVYYVGMQQLPLTRAED